MIRQFFNDKKNITRGVFKNKDVFTLNHMPETLKHRDKQIFELVENVRNIDYNSVPGNLVLKGKFATGKTTTVKLFFEEAERQYDNLTCIYINCQMFDTENKVLLQIYNHVLGRCIQNGLNNTRLIQSILDELGDDYLIVCLDEFQNIKGKKDLNNLLYSLSRSHEYKQDSKISTWLITTYDTSWEMHLNDQVFTVFRPQTINFPQYTKDEIKSILSNRVELGFYPDVLSGNELQDIVDATYIRGDLRYGINALKEIGENKEYFIN